MKLIRLTLLISAVLFAQGAFSQKILVLDKPGHVKRVRFYEGDFIELKTEENVWVAGEIASILDSSILIGKKNVKLSEIRVIYSPKTGYWWDKLSKVTLRASGLYFGIDSFNRGINKEQPLFRENAILLSGSLFTVGVISSWLGNRKFKINSRHRIKIIDLTI